MAPLSSSTGRLTIAALAIAIAAASAGAHAQSATLWDREAQRLHDEVVRRGRTPAAIVPLIELGSNWELAPARTTTLVHALAGNRRVVPSVRAYARAYEAVLLRRAGQRERAQEISESLGFVRRWRVLGPFDNRGKHGFGERMGPELALDRETDLAAEHQGIERTVGWDVLPDLGPGEIVPLAPFLTPSTEVCAFAETFVEIERARPLSILVGATGAVRVYWNGAEALADPVYRTIDNDRAAAAVVGHAGWNRVLVKVCGDDLPVAFMLRVSEADGTPMRVRADPEGARLPSPAPRAAIVPPPAPITILAALEAAVAAAPEDAAAHEALARYLAYTHGEDRSTSRVRDLAVRATELGATAENLLFASRQQRTRADRVRLLERAVALAPRDPRIALEHAYVISTGPAGERALRMLEAIPPDSPSGLSAMAIRADLLGRLELDESAHALREELVRRVPTSVRYLRALAASEDARGHTERALELRRRVLAIRADDGEARRALVGDAVMRSAREEAMALVQAELALDPVATQTMYWAAGIYDAVGAESEAIDVLRAAADLDRDDADARVALGRMLLRHDRRDAALATLREALALRPQDASTRMLVEQIQPEARPDEAYATPIETILARRRPDGEWPATILHDLEVHTVHESGLGRSFRQVVTQIHDEEGARAFRSFAFTYEPGSQWVDVRLARVLRGDEVLTSFRVGESALAQPQYRIYYSARQVVVTFPVLEPGDVVEIRYRVEDVAARNAYADYFGAIRPLQHVVPVARIEHVFLTPTARRFFFHAPETIGRDERVDGGTRIQRFWAEDVAALRSEPMMPGYTETAPYLHVSTYETWDQVGRFWWGLADDQLAPDAALERTVRDLVAGAPDVRTKVQRIYAWATDHVRYVGLELGIHGHMPYRVTDVVQRGFGDCKDSASLIYTMLRIAGIDARIALVRTAQNGAIERSPASLAVFDHAIAYVPELDLFLDGTAEHGGSTELPSMDVGAMVLVVGPDGSELRSIPARAPDASGSSFELRIELAADGRAQLRGAEELRGQEAMGARGTYEAPGTRRERLSRALAGSFPGIEIAEETFEPMTDREQPVRFSWAASVPQIGERSGASVRIAPSTIGGLTQSWAPLATRRQPLVLGAAFHRRERRVIALGSLRAEDVPQGGVADSPFGRLSVRYSRSGGDVVIETDLTVSRDRVTPAEYPAFRAWTQQADALLRARVTIGGVR